MVVGCYQGRGAASPSSQSGTKKLQMDARGRGETGCLVTFVEKLSKQGQQHGAIEKPKLDNVRKLRGIYYVDVEDMEFEECAKKVGSANGICNAV